MEKESKNGRWFPMLTLVLSILLFFNGVLILLGIMSVPSISLSISSILTGLIVILCLVFGMISLIKKYEGRWMAITGLIILVVIIILAIILNALMRVK